MKKSLFAQEIERVGLNRTHAEKAFEQLRDGNKRGPYDVLYHRSRPKINVVWAVLDGDGTRYFLKQAAALAYLFACADKGELGDPAPFDTSWNTNDVLDDMEWYNYEEIWNKLGFQIKQYKESEDDGADIDGAPGQVSESSYDEEIELLKQFSQIVLYGPPGTGKTYAAKGILAGMFGADKWRNLQGEQWDIVQFHPSYNYEDFVRGVQVQTENGEISYKTVNRTFGKMCKWAEEDSDNQYALIIDEINRANVSAVLGELIYALEYRGKSVRTPYSLDDNPNIKIPENLYIIGTMNTADRTIGQIDYAVRRRFAFKYCGPDRKVVAKNAPHHLVLDIYDEVRKLFNYPNNNGYLSKDFDVTDVEIGHSYFLSDKDKERDVSRNQQIANKIIWQVVPILREYVKDGVLLPGAADKIKYIKELAEDLRTKKPQAGESAVADLPAKGKMQYFYWEKDGRREFGGEQTAREKENQGYAVGKCHIVSLGEGAWRSWECCRMYNFFSSGGSPAYHTVMKSLQIGDIVFVYLAEAATEKGCIAYGKVVSGAELVGEFITPRHGKLAECDVGGEKYADKFRFAVEGIGRSGEKVPPDMAVGVEWLPPSPIKPMSFAPAPQGGGGGKISNINSEVWKKLCAAFNLNSGENLE